MNEKTEELRSIFMDVTDEDTVTERQEESRGSLTADDRQADERIREVIAEMRDSYEFATDLSDDGLVRVVRLFYDGASDGDIADELDVDRRVVFRARLDLHLQRESDAEAPFDLADLRDMMVDDTPVVEMADRLGVAESTVRRYRRVVEARHEARRVSDRFRAAFQDALTDADLSSQMTEEVKQDGLQDATEGMETDVSF